VKVYRFLVRASLPRSLSSLLWLTLGAFAIGTEGFMIAGLLPALARDLTVGLPAAGQPRAERPTVGHGSVNLDSLRTRG
jgi:hypothetical protein